MYLMSRQIFELLVLLLILWQASETRAKIISDNTTFFPFPNCSRKCGNIDFEYPFGIGHGCFHPGLDLTCNHSTNPPKLFLGNTTHEVTRNIRVVDGVVYINTAIVTMSINETFKQYPLLNLGSRPYTLALSDDDIYSENFDAKPKYTLWVFGCSVTAIIFDIDTDRTLGSCSNLCTEEFEVISSRDWDQYDCLEECCTIAVGNSRSYGIKLFRLDQLDFPKSNASIIKVVLSDKDNGISGSELNVENSSLMTEVAVNWYINDQPSCANAKNQTSYACLSTHSDCHDDQLVLADFVDDSVQYLHSVEGYLCSCLTNYKGNPYLPHGCEERFHASHSSNNCTRRCGSINVSYPFGLEDACYRDTSFALSCNQRETDPILLFSDDRPFQVTNISIKFGQIEVKDLQYSRFSNYGGLYKPFTLFQERGAILNWVIEYQTCEEAKKNKTEFACRSDHSFCWEVNLTNETYFGVLSGYRCNCSHGYSGNPYVPAGCQDIDECNYPDIYSCHGLCSNTIGSYSCKCGFGMSGDPTKGPCIAAHNTQNSLLLGVIVGLSLGIGMLLIALNLVFHSRRWKKRSKIKLRQKNFQKNHGLLLQQLLSSQESTADKTNIFTQTELEKATNNFDSSRILGCGGHGTVYKGILSNQHVVAIKRSKIIKKSEIDQFINEVAILSHINHRNVVKLFGCCLETEVPLLVFEFISNGTLYDHLHNHQSWLPWNDRLRIATEVSGALAYLHSAASISIFHRDVKSSNILLDDCYTVKVSDFGASRSIPPDKTHVVTAVQGTFGYLDPEYYQTGQLTEKSDVYSFGVILLELLTGRMPVSVEQEEHRSLPMQFLQAMQENRLLDFVDVQIRNEATEDDLDEVVRLADMCLKFKGNERPTMKEVEHKLQGLKKSKQHESLQQIVENCQENVSLLSNYTQAGTRNYTMEMEMVLSVGGGR